MLEAAEAALEDAHRSGTEAIRAYSPEIHLAAESRHVLAEEIVAAMDSGQILPWFQPQISTDTGQIVGFEALARWVHPERGIVPPAEFLDAVQSAGQMERLGEIMLFQGLSALRLWDRSDHHVPRVAVNFSGAELHNPRLVDKIRWELDRFDLTPDRLVVEILETAVSEVGNDAIDTNIAGLARLGCQIDLDDFGTGHASIANIRRFAISRIKIDRTFVTRIDADPDQHKMVAAILSLAERLDLQTLAEGVETIGERAALAQLGCGALQGHAIAEPMAFEDTMVWLDRHARKLGRTPSLPRSGAA